MPSLKKSAMISEETQGYAAARTKTPIEEVTWSAPVNEAFKALKWLSNEALPDLSPSEWEVILNAYAGSIVSFNPPFRVASDLMDDAGAISLEELKPDHAAIVKRVHGMSQIEQFAIMDFVQKFWARDWSDCEDFREIIDRIKGA